MTIAVALGRRSRRLSLGLGCFGWVLLAMAVGGCPSVSQQVSSRTALPSHSVKPRLLFRGLKSGMSPAEVEKTICRTWSLLQSCRRLQAVAPHRALGLIGMRPSLPDLEVFRYQGQRELRCVYAFFFRKWGLSAVRSSCKAHGYKQLRAQVRRYRRWFGKPKRTSRMPSQYRYKWSQDKGDWQVTLRVRRRSSTALHVDLRRRWHDLATSLEPSIEHSDLQSLKAWGKVTFPVRREVLVNMGHIIDRLKHAANDRQDVRIATTDWTPETAPQSCRPVAQSGVWNVEPWKGLGFRSPTPPRLRYRFRKIRMTRRSKKRGKLFLLLEAQGCGFAFSVRLRWVGKDWEYDPLVVRANEAKASDDDAA